MMGNISDIVFPLCVGRMEDGAMKYFKSVGTGFYIGQQGYGLTAAHVINQCKNDYPEFPEFFAMFHDHEYGQYLSKRIDEYELHPTEDIAIIKMNVADKPVSAVLHVSLKNYNHTTEYSCWAFPKNEAEELMNLYDDKRHQYAIIYTQGYIRRRVSRSLSAFSIGANFYELSEQVGHGASGAPVILKSTEKFNIIREVIGIYVSEIDGPFSKVSYAVRMADVGEWKPKLLSHSIEKESQNLM